MIQESKKVSIEAMKQDRAGFKSLLTRNINHFGNLEVSELKPVKKLVADTTFEDLTCVGFNPEKGMLEATIAIKQPSGYAGDLCQLGSKEYVRFFVDTGSGWQDAGLTAVTVHDVPTNKDCAGKADKPLTYVASLKYDHKTKCCEHPTLPGVRAILSWNWAPPANNALWLPPWGTRHDCHVQLQPGPFNFGCLFEHLNLELPLEYVAIADQPIPNPDPGPLKLGELAEIYSAKAHEGTAAATASAGPYLVEPHRFGLVDVHPALAEGTFNQALISNKAENFKLAGLDWLQAIELLEKTKADVSYEELECLGIDELFPERLVATFRIKKQLGYSGDLCQKGSLEYIAFWADWDNKCEWTYLGTQTVNVHDFKTLPEGGLCYSAMQPIDLREHRRTCKEPKIARIRAVLSWNVAPSPSNPDDLKYYGNRVDTHILIEPGEVGSVDNAEIRNIGGIAVEDIDTNVALGNGMTKSATFGGGSVIFAHTPGKTADGWGLDRECPFGGTVWIEGVDFFFPNYYRVRVRKHLDHTVVNALTGDFYVERTGPGYDHQVSDKEWFQYLSGSHMNRLLAFWPSSGDEQWEVQLDIATAPAEASIVSSSPWYLIQLDNTPPLAPPAAPPTMDIHLTSVGDCKDVTQGATITGMFIADDPHFAVADDHFGGWSLATEPNTAAFPSNQPVVVGLAPTDPAPGPGGHTWTVETVLPPPGVVMDPCGYVVRLDVSDRSILGSSPGLHNSNHIEVGFCLRSKN